MQISIIGSGYVGLVTGACLAEKGHCVTCVDIDEKRIAKIQKLDVPFFEKDLRDLIEKNLGKRFFVTTNLTSAVVDSEITIIAVGTPFAGSNVDLSFVKQASCQIGKALKSKKAPQHFLIVKSTVPPGTTDNVIAPIVKKALLKKANLNLEIGVNPEFLSEGQAVNDFFFPDRLIIGGGKAVFEKLDEMYSFIPEVPRIFTNNKTAEMIKYTSNAMLANAISFSNEIANLCSALPDVDVVDVMKGVHLSQYLRPAYSTGEHVQAPISSFFIAGCGYGGSCLPKDTKTIVAFAKKMHVDMPLLTSVIKINESQPENILKILKTNFGTLRNSKILVLGLSYKPDTNDVRESPAIKIIRLLAAEDAIISAYDPVAIDEASKVLKDVDVHYFHSLPEAVQNVEAIIIVTSWKEFDRLPELLNKRKIEPLVVDGRRMLDKTSIKHYSGIGLQYKK